MHLLNRDERAKTRAWTHHPLRPPYLVPVRVRVPLIILPPPLPAGYIAKAGDFKAKGVDDIVVLSVNDCFVMRAWEKTFDTDKVCVCD